jgi:ribokinase
VNRNSELIRNAAIALAQLEIPLETVSRLAVLTAQHHVPLMLDPAPARALPESLLGSVDWLTPNETETTALL